MGTVKSHSQESEVAYEINIKILTCYTAEGEDFLQRILTSNEN